MAELDKGIEGAVRILQAAGIETFESCEGGEGHAYRVPTIRLYGSPEAGWRAVAACLANGLPITEIRRTWDILDGGEPVGPHWEVTFRESVRDIPAPQQSDGQSDGEKR